MENKSNVVKPAKKSIWTLIKESMNKASGGCGPACGCHVESQGSKDPQKDAPKDAGRDKEQA